MEDVIRKCVAFSLPKVLKAAASRDPAARESVKHVLPSYTLYIYDKQGNMIPSSVIEPYFVTDLFKDRGKKRVYINENGYVISYIRRKKIHRIKPRIQELLEKCQKDFNDIVPEDLAKRIVDEFADKWVVTKGRPDFSDFTAFLSKVVAVQCSTVKTNYPTQDDCVYYPLRMSNYFIVYDGIVKASASVTDKRSFERNSMYDLVSLGKYAL